MLNFEKIYNALNSDKSLNPKIIKPTKRDIKGFSTDTRDDLTNKIFFAIKGNTFDGNDFLLDAIRKDASLLICHKTKTPNVTGRPARPQDKQSSCWLSLEDKDNTTGIIAVEDTTKAYQVLASYVVALHKPKIVGITGSNGKSTSKTMLHTIIKKYFNCEASQKSFNNHIGVPHTLLKTKKNTEVVIVEMGTNRKGDIKNLVQIAKPEIAVVTNVSNSHLKGLGSISGVAKEKQKIYKTAKIGVFNLDNEWTKKMYNSFKGEKITFSTKSDADIMMTISGMTMNHLDISGNIAGTKNKTKIEIFGKHNIYNILTASALSLALGMKPASIWDALPELKTIWGRNQKVLLKNKAMVIFDGYNANPASVMALLENAKILSSKHRIFLFLADMLELGDKACQLHKEIGQLCGKLPFEAIFFAGCHAKSFEIGVKNSEFKKSLVIFDSYKQDLAIRLENMLKEGDILFVKGSRGLKLENLIYDLKPLSF